MSDNVTSISSKNCKPGNKGIDKWLDEILKSDKCIFINMNRRAIYIDNYNQLTLFYKNSLGNTSYLCSIAQKRNHQEYKCIMENGIKISLRDSCNGFVITIDDFVISNYPSANIIDPLTAEEIINYKLS